MDEAKPSWTVLKNPRGMCEERGKALPRRVNKLKIFTKAGVLEIDGKWVRWGMRRSRKPYDVKSEAVLANNAIEQVLHGRAATPTDQRRWHSNLRV